MICTFCRIIQLDKGSIRIGITGGSIPPYYIGKNYAISHQLIKTSDLTRLERCRISFCYARYSRPGAKVCGVVPSLPINKFSVLFDLPSSLTANQNIHPSVVLGLSTFPLYSLSFMNVCVVLVIAITSHRVSNSSVEYSAGIKTDLRLLPGVAGFWVVHLDFPPIQQTME